jgi:5,10-methylenetetrahydromethanopterin reductase
MRDAVGLFLPNHWTLLECLSAVKYAEARGFDSVWQAEVAFSRDPFLTMASYTHATRRIGLGVGVVHQPTRTLPALSAALMTLDDLAPRRVRCALGPWNDQEALRAGVMRPKPLLAMRETLAALRRLLALERVTMGGETLQLVDVQAQPIERPEARAVSFLLAGTGAFHALAGEIADGIILNGMVTPAYTAYALEEAHVGLRKARRDPAKFEVAQLILCSVQTVRESETTAFQRAQQAVLQAVLQRPDWMRANGFPQEVLAECCQWAQIGLGEVPEAAYKLLTPDLVRQVVAFGSEAEVRQRVRDYVAAGATLPVLVPLNADVRPVVDAFAQGYREPFLRSEGRG